MKKVGLTGGIGSGKSTVAKAFEALGVPVFNADAASKLILESHDIKPQLVKLFGKKAISDSGLVNRSFIASLVFSDSGILEDLNRLLHPKVFEAFDKWAFEKRHLKYIMKEAAILFESGADKGLDYIVTVAAPEKLRIERVKKRDKLPEEQIKKRILNQFTDEERIRRSTFTVYNDEVVPLLPRILELHKYFNENPV